MFEYLTSFGDIFFIFLKRVSQLFVSVAKRIFLASFLASFYITDSQSNSVPTLLVKAYYINDFDDLYSSLGVGSEETPSCLLTSDGKCSKFHL